MFFLLPRDEISDHRHALYDPFLGQEGTTVGPIAMSLSHSQMDPYSDAIAEHRLEPLQQLPHSATRWKKRAHASSVVEIDERVELRSVSREFHATAHESRRLHEIPVHAATEEPIRRHV